VDINWSSEGKRIVTASWDGTARIWDAEIGTTLHTLNGHTDDVWEVGWSPDGSRVATASFDKTARIWDAASGATLYTLPVILKLSWMSVGVPTVPCRHCEL